MRTDRRRALPVILVALALVTGACSSNSTLPSGSTATTTPAAATSPTSATASTVPGSTASPCATQTAAPRFTHVVWVWMENHSRDAVIDNPDAPYVSSLAHACGSATQYATVGSPSLPNYLGATSGSTWGISDDASPSAHPLAVDNLFRQVRTAGGTERSYEEAMPTDCNLGSNGRYAVKHNPAAYYVGADDRAACQTGDVPLPGTLGSLPTFLFVTPDLCHDTHDCSVKTGDQWLAGWLPQLLNGPDYRAGTTAVFLIWDEYTPMPNVIISPSTPSGALLGTRVDHYSLLRTTEELLGLPLLAKASSAPSMRAAFNL